MISEQHLSIQLFTTQGCHLCEDALLLLQQAQGELDFDISLVEIAESEALVESYALRIPVLKKSTDASELGWPFDLSALKAFLSG